MKRIVIFLCVFLCVLESYGQTRIKSMFYNALYYSNTQVSRDKTPHLRTILDEVAPDLLMLCEMENEAGSNYLFTNAVDPHNTDFEQVPWQNIQSNSSGGITQTVYYNGKKLVYESARVIPTNTRDINHYTFKINTENVNTNPIRLEVFVTHLKASQGSTNRQRRLSSVEDFVAALEDIPSSSFVIFAGDFNFYTSNEEGYIRLLSDQNPIEIIDPINRPATPFPNNSNITDPFDFYSSSSEYFWRNSSFADIHSQSTRTFTAGLIDQGGAGGGLDDRFDFIMMSKNFNSSSTLFYVPNSYKTIGNNGNCYNSYISNPSCNGTYSQNLRNSLLEFSDHLPIVMEIETPENTLSTNTYSTEILLPKGNVITTELEIQIPNQIQNEVHTVFVYDISGRKVIQKRVSVSNISTPLTLSTSSLSTGIYYLSTNLGNKPVKFVKN